MSQTTDLKERAIRLLARRDYSGTELARKLTPYGNADAIDAVLRRMRELGLQDDRRFAQSWVRSKSRRMGVKRMRYELAQKGIDPALLDEVLMPEAIGASEYERAMHVWSVRYGKVPADYREWAKQASFLQARGFSGDTIRQVLRDTPEAQAEERWHESA